MSTPDRLPFKVADLDLAELGRREIRLAEHEMPGLMALRERYKGKRPLDARPEPCASARRIRPSSGCLARARIALVRNAGIHGILSGLLEAPAVQLARGGCA